jgi:hypothetical protein
MAGTWLDRNLEVTAFESGARSRPDAAHGQAAIARVIGTEAAIADRFGGRDALIALHHFAKTVIFGVSPVPNVLIGRDGWLFFLGEDGKSIDRDYRGVIPYPPDEPMRVAAELKRRHDYLAARGIAYVVAIVPDKSTIYPEYLPSWVTHVQGGTGLDRFYSALHEYPDLKVLDLRPALIEAKARERQYFKTDSHWNYLGATTGYELLIGAVKSLVPSVPRACRTTVLSAGCRLLAGRSDDDAGITHVACGETTSRQWRKWWVTTAAVAQGQPPRHSLPGPRSPPRTPWCSFAKIRNCLWRSFISIQWRSCSCRNCRKIFAASFTSPAAASIKRWSSAKNPMWSSRNSSSGRCMRPTLLMRCLRQYVRPLETVWQGAPRNILTQKPRWRLPH